MFFRVELRPGQQVDTCTMPCLFALPGISSYQFHTRTPKLTSFLERGWVKQWSPQCDGCKKSQMAPAMVGICLNVRHLNMVGFWGGSQVATRLSPRNSRFGIPPMAQPISVKFAGSRVWPDNRNPVAEHKEVPQDTLLESHRVLG